AENRGARARARSCERPSCSRLTRCRFRELVYLLLFSGIISSTHCIEQLHDCLPLQAVPYVQMRQPPRAAPSPNEPQPAALGSRVNARVKPRANEIDASAASTP